MTSILYIAGGSADVESNFTMSFFIPMSLQDNPPLPLDELVYIEVPKPFLCNMLLYVYR